jgi:hypothetical protein
MEVNRELLKNFGPKYYLADRRNIQAKRRKNMARSGSEFVNNLLRDGKGGTANDPQFQAMWMELQKSQRAS